MTIHDFEFVFRAHYTRLYYVACDFVGDKEASKDIVAEAFTKVWERRDEVSADKLEGLLFVTVRNLCANHLRRLKSARRYMQYVAASESFDDESSLKEMETRIAEIQHVLESLPERTRHVVEECSLNGKSYKEVAEEMNISTSSVKKHVVTAYSKLRQHFKVKKK